MLFNSILPRRARRRDRRRWPASLNAMLLLFGSWIALVILSLQPRQGAAAVAAIFPPWWEADRAFLAAASTGAEIVRTGAFPTILILKPAADHGLARLHEAGAWLAVDPQALGGCLGKLST